MRWKGESEVTPSFWLSLERCVLDTVISGNKERESLVPLDLVSLPHLGSGGGG